MARKLLDADEIAELRESPFIESISSGKIKFTPEFKRMAYRQLVDGKTMREIFEENGIDPDILGNARIWGFSQKLKLYAEREEGFTDLRSSNSRKEPKESKEQTLANKVEQLEHGLAYTRQEVEFLKKIRMADLEARKQWESNHRPK